ncbi:MAG TPA: DUF929 family protein, partial [Mycobacteriales bacterium]|nr:DUF929 family protein [Mycobacteriales bacterium]
LVDPINLGINKSTGRVVVGRETNKQRREKQAVSAREKAASARAAQARLDQRRRARTILSSVLALGVVIAVIAVIAITQSGKSNNNPAGDPVAATDTVVNGVTGIAPASYDTVGQGSANLDAVKAINDPALTKDGKPELLFIGAEFCPYCAAERWSLINALSRFGTFTDLDQVRSANDDGNLATFSFRKSSYTSKYLAFVPVEDEDRDSQQLMKPTSAENTIWMKYTQGSFPFLYYGGKYVQTQVGFSIDDLSGLNWTQIIADLKNPGSTVAKDIIGEANVDTKLICQMIDNADSSVCSASALNAINLPSASA